MKSSESFLTSNRIIYCFIVLLLWTVTSFLCHFSGKTFLNHSSNTSLNETMENTKVYLLVKKCCHGIGLTLLQLGLCYIVVYAKDVESASSSYCKVAMIGHALATLTTNISMAMMFASSTFAIKLMEPITSAIIQYLLLGIPLTPVTIASLPVIVGGAITFAGNPLEYSGTSFGTFAAVLSNLILAFRNVAIKQMTKDSIRINVHWRKLIGCGIAVSSACSILYILEKTNILQTHFAFTLAAGCVSALFHVLYSYVSTGMVLNKISVVSHAVANILKRVLVVLLLYTFGKRIASTANFLGLASCSVGLMVYVWDKTRHHDKTPADSQGKRIKFPRFRSSGFLYFGIAGLCVLSLLSFDYTNISAIHEKNRRELFQNPVKNVRKLFSKLRDNEIPIETKTIENDHINENLFAHKQEGQNRHFSRSSFTARGEKRPTDEELQPVMSDLDKNLSSQVETFLQHRLIDEPFNANFLSKKLTRTSEVIREAQRIHFNMFNDVLRKYKYAMLFDVEVIENKGDPCINVGEIYFLRRMNITLIYYCNFSKCTQKNIRKAADLAQNYSPDNLVILSSGGGNIIGYSSNDYMRFNILEAFPNFHVMVFPQSIWMPNRHSSHVENTIKNYCCHPNLTIVLRDNLSYSIAKELYNGSTRILMAPDMAFQIGHAERCMSPVFDILWLKRGDGESPKYNMDNNIPNNLRVHVSDWWQWVTNKGGTSLENVFNIATNGFFFLQRGRVVITDRLHGHILSTLMDIPHVLIDNKARKLSSYHNTWTQSVENIVLTDDPSKALGLAIELLRKYNDTLPAVVPFLDLSEDFKPVVRGRLRKGYP